MAAPLVFSETDVRHYCAALFVRAGWPQRDAAIAAGHVVTSDLSGHPSHGMGMIPIYVDAIERGALKPSNQPVEKLRTGSLLVIEANTALGQVAAHDATQAAIDLAGESGLALVNLLHAHHIGRIGDYAEQAARAGMIGLFWVNVAIARPIVVPFGGRERRYSTNPQAVGIPRAGGQPFLLDFATSKVAHGKTRVAWLQGKKTPFGAVIDTAGKPTDDPTILWPTVVGGLAPFGDHKGYGLALVSELLSTILGGGDTIADKTDPDTIHNSMLAIVIDPRRFESVAQDWQARAERFLDWVKSSAPAEGVEQVMIPGDPEFLARKAAQGLVRYDPESWKLIADAGMRVGLSESEIPRAR